MSLNSPTKKNEALLLELTNDSKFIELLAENEWLQKQLVPERASGASTVGSREQAKGNKTEMNKDENEKKEANRPRSRYWTEDEHERFLEAVRVYGYKNVKAISEVVKTRNPTQVRTHAQKYLLKMNKMGQERRSAPRMNLKRSGEQAELAPERLRMDSGEPYFSKRLCEALERAQPALRTWPDPKPRWSAKGSDSRPDYPISAEQSPSVCGEYQAARPLWGGWERNNDVCTPTSRGDYPASSTCSAESTPRSNYVNPTMWPNTANPPSPYLTPARTTTGRTHSDGQYIPLALSAFSNGGTEPALETQALPLPEPLPVPEADVQPDSGLEFVDLGLVKGPWFSALDGC